MSIFWHNYLEVRAGATADVSAAVCVLVGRRMCGGACVPVLGRTACLYVILIADYPAGWYACVSFSCLSVCLQCLRVSILLISSMLCLNLISHVWWLWVSVCAHVFAHICLNEGCAWLSNLQPS